MVWFTADWHFYHDKILEFHPKRKELFGTNMKEVTEKMIQKWNSRVSKKDTVYILGDLAFGDSEQKRKLFQRLNGNKVLILGNHDKVVDYNTCYFNHITQIKNMKFKKSIFPSLSKDTEVIMCHFPIFSWEHIEKGSIMLHGHCHGTIDNDNATLALSKKIRIDVGLDSEFANYDLVSIDKLAKYINKIAVNTIDILVKDEKKEEKVVNRESS